MDVRSLLLKIKDNLSYMSPEIFDNLSKDKDYKESFFYLLACVLLSIPIEILVYLLAGESLEAMVMLVLTLPVMMAMAYVAAALLHLFLKIVGGKATLLQTVSVLFYALTISIILGGIPLVGLLASIIALINQVNGASRVHKIPWWKALVALFVLPLVLLVVVILIFSLLF